MYSFFIYLVRFFSYIPRLGLCSSSCTFSLLKTIFWVGEASEVIDRALLKPSTLCRGKKKNGALLVVRTPFYHCHPAVVVADATVNRQSSSSIFAAMNRVSLKGVIKVYTSTQRPPKKKTARILCCRAWVLYYGAIRRYRGVMYSVCACMAAIVWP